MPIVAALALVARLVRLCRDKLPGGVRRPVLRRPDHRQCDERTVLGARRLSRLRASSASSPFLGWPLLLLWLAATVPAETFAGRLAVTGPAAGAVVRRGGGGVRLQRRDRPPLPAAGAAGILGIACPGLRGPRRRGPAAGLAHLPLAASAGRRGRADPRRAGGADPAAGRRDPCHRADGARNRRLGARSPSSAGGHPASRPYLLAATPVLAVGAPRASPWRRWCCRTSAFPLPRASRRSELHRVEGGVRRRRPHRHRRSGSRRARPIHSSRWTRLDDAVDGGLLPDHGDAARRRQPARGAGVHRDQVKGGWREIDAPRPVRCDLLLAACEAREKNGSVGYFAQCGRVGTSTSNATANSGPDRQCRQRRRPPCRS